MRHVTLAFNLRKQFFQYVASAHHPSIRFNQKSFNFDIKTNAGKLIVFRGRLRNKRCSKILGKVLVCCIEHTLLKKSDFQFSCTSIDVDLHQRFHIVQS